MNGLLIEEGKIIGVKTSLGTSIYGRSVVLTAGTFLNGLIHIGDKNFGGGRAGEKASTGITEDLVKLGFESGRMKTGTPPRVDGRSLDFSKMIEQPGDKVPEKFSFSNITYWICFHILQVQACMLGILSVILLQTFMHAISAIKGLMCYTRRDMILLAYPPNSMPFKQDNIRPLRLKRTSKPTDAS